MRIDAHIHGKAGGFAGDPGEYVRSCETRGVEKVVLIEKLEDCLEAAAKFGDFVVPVARVDMDSDGPAEVADCVAAGCRGVKFIRPRAPYSDERYWPLYGKLEELGATAVFHTGYVMFKGREERPVRMTHMRAAEVEAVARRFPDLKILMAHFSNPWWEEAWKVSLSSPNVYADLSGGTAIMRSIRMWAETFAPDGEIIERSVRKLVFASDVTYFKDEGFPFEPFIEFYEKIFDAIGLSDELRELVNRGNARALFGLDTA